MNRPTGHDRLGLQFPREIAEALRLAVKEHDVDGPVVPHQLLDLGEIELHQAWIITRLHFRDASLYVDLVLPQPPEIVRREVDTRGDALRAERIEDFAREVVLVGRVHDAEVSGLGVPHGESGMVFGGEDDVPDTGQLRQGGPIRGLEFARIECLRQLFKKALQVGFVGAGQRMRNHDAGLAIHRPMNEQAESLVAKPLQPFRSVQRSSGDIALRHQEGT